MEQNLYRLWFKLLYPTATSHSAAILDAFNGDAYALYQANTEDYRASGFMEKDITKLTNKDLSDAQTFLDKCAQSGAILLWQTDPCYPHALDSLSDRPSLLFALGDVSVLNQSAVCIVGSRISSARGSAVAAKLTQQAISSGFVPVTGAATGIDSVVLCTAASLRSPAISVAAAGLDIVYPSDVAVTRQKLCAAGGVVISEFLFGFSARSHHFPIRNRLLPALSQGVFIAEAGLKSGALLTAEFAKVQKKPLFAVPGYIDDLNFSGCNRLILQGATLVADIEEAMSSLGMPKKTTPVTKPTPPLIPTAEKKEKQKSVPTNSILHQICQTIADKSMSIDEIIIKTGFSAAEVSTALVLGCLQEFLEKTPDDRYSVK